MLVTIFGTAAFFIVVMMVLLIGMEHFHWFEAGSGPNPEGWDLDPLNIRQVSIFFTVYVFFQVWNQINARSLTPDMSGFSGLFKNRTFLAIAGTVAVVQALHHQRAVCRHGLQRGAARLAGLAVDPGGDGVGAGVRRGAAARAAGDEAGDGVRGTQCSRAGSRERG